MVADKLVSYGAAKRELLPEVEHRRSRYPNNRCEVSHQPSRRRERHMRRLESDGHAQKLLSVHTRIHNHFQLRRHYRSASEYRVARYHAFSICRAATGAALVYRSRLTGWPCHWQLCLLGSKLTGPC
ncbi:DDE-type integrase/transposase/recombinase [Microvirga makkahensis]|uniref:DDE-type integrase/transposase/recombinase n=1 Tax=Microvirga makkahensis TaxID=1128670 RepID=UPI0031B5B5DD